MLLASEQQDEQQLLVETAYKKHNLAEVGLTADDLDTICEHVGYKALDALNTVNEAAVREFHEKTGKSQNDILVRKNVLAELTAERKHMLRVIRKNGTDSDGVLFVWYLWLLDHNINFRAALELCEYHGTSLVAASYRNGTPFEDIEFELSR